MSRGNGGRVRRRHTQTLRTDLVAGPFSPAEDRRILAAVAAGGSDGVRWAELGRAMCRSDASVRERYTKGLRTDLVTGS